MTTELFEHPSRGIAPPNGLGALVAVSQVVHDRVFHLINGFEMSWAQDLPLQWGENDFDLIQPRGIFRQPVDANSVRESQTVDPCIDLFGSVSRSIVENQVQDGDLFGPKTREDRVQKVLEVDETLPVEETGYSLSCVDQESRKEIRNSQPLVATTSPQGLARSGCDNAARDPQRLNAGFLVRADNDFPPASQFPGLFVEIEHDRCLFEEERIGRFLPRPMLPGLYLLLTKPLPDGRRAYA